MPVAIHKIVFLMPVFNDFDSLIVVIREITKLAKQSGHLNDFEFLVVDDCSSKDGEVFAKASIREFKNVKIIKTDMRSGSQGAILKGLDFLIFSETDRHVVILDSDGEDRPVDAITIAEKLISCEGPQIIQSARGKRYSGILFSLSYFMYSCFFRVLVGKNTPPGNFMGINNSILKKIVLYPGITKHIAASIARYSPEITSIRFNRGSRISGVSKMNFTSLFGHAYGSLSVYADLIFFRVLLFLLTLLFAIFSTGFVLFVLKSFGWITVIPGWTSLVLLIIFSAVFMVGSNLVLLLLLMLKLDK